MSKNLTNGKYNFNSAIIIENAIDSENKTVKAVLSEETKVLRYNWEDGYYDLILEHTTEAIDFSRKDIMPVLLQHYSHDLPMGIWEDVRLEDGKVKATARFDSEDEKAMEIFGKLERGIMKSFSIGINVEKMELVDYKNENGRKTYKATKWQLQEASVVTIPAIPNAKVGFSEENINFENEQKQKEEILCYNDNVNKKNEERVMTREQLQAEHPALYAQIFNAGADSVKDIVAAHVEMSKTTGANAFALECIEKFEPFSATIQAKYIGFGLKNQEIQLRQDENLGAVDVPGSEAQQKEDARDKAFAEAFNFKG